MKRLLLLIIISILLSDCNKITDEWFYTRVKGYVRAWEFIPDATVVILKAKRKKSTPVYEEFRRISTDENGFFEIRFKADKDFVYCAYAEKKEMCFVSDTFGFGNGQECEFVLNGNLNNHFKIHIKNVNPHDNNDKFMLWNYTLTGMNVDTVVNAHPWFQSHGNASYTFYWTVMKNYSQTNYSQSVFIKACSTDSLHIDY
ncbi:MAG: hypothetical protein V2A54_16100 [Bacteroidota bacterium]